MEEFISKIEDLYKRSTNRNIITYTGFLTPAEKQIIINNFKTNNILFLGGAESSERVRAFFMPDYMDKVNIDEYIVAFKAVFSFRELSHRDFLGAILSLGIERRCVGDIYVFEKEAYFFVTSDVANFIKINLDKVANIGVKIREIRLNEVKVLEPKFKDIEFCVASLRIDALVAGSIRESREKASAYIKNGTVLLNYMVCENVSEKVEEGDVFSVKGHGKFYISEIGGVSRRGKIFIKVKQYV